MGTAMETKTDRLLAASRATIDEVLYCWVATEAEDGGAHARAVRVFTAGPEDDDWTRRFLCRRGSRKVAEMRRNARVTLAYQHVSGDVYVALVGNASLVEDRAEMRSLWQGDWDEKFPPGFADANMIVAKIHVDRIETHARGITAEPFGHGRTFIERDAATGWRLMPD